MDLHYFHPSWVAKSDERLRADVCVYGGTSAGIAAAVAAIRAGKTAVILHPGKIVGGLTTGGLGETDYGRKHVIGGLSRRFYRDCGTRYGKDEEFQFEPHVAAAVYSAWLSEYDVPVRLCQFVDRVELEGARIKSVTMLGGLRCEAKAFIDATYE
ncbi:MAG TPA: FAD-dependent oxidoreductase, partial [Tepidisphaeraceae bacterium]|nr:FAD-dependent oxidoreductase [Tepidisphaeraceae bacterium]